MLSHANVVAAISAVLLQLGDYKPISSDLMISYLPLAYMLERCCQVINCFFLIYLTGIITAINSIRKTVKVLSYFWQNGMYLVGGRVGFFNGNMKYLTEDLKILKPTVMPAVPRLLNRIYESEMANIRPSFIKRLLFNVAMNAKHSQLKR